MLQDMMKAIDDANGVPQDMWIRIITTIGDQDPAVQPVCCYGGRYYITEAQRKRLQQMIPFMSGGPLCLPAPSKPDPARVKFENAGCLAGPDRCGRCKGPFHPATGHAFSETVVACHVCYGRFAAWQLQRQGWTGPLTAKQKKKLDKKRKKQEKAEKAIAKELVRKIAAEEAERERLYGKPRIAQPAREPGQNPILER